MFTSRLSSAGQCEYPFPKMEAIGELELFRAKSEVTNETNRLEWKFKYKKIENASRIMYWPKDRLEDVLDEPKCGFKGDKCVKTKTGPSGLLYNALKRPFFQT